MEMNNKHVWMYGWIRLWVICVSLWQSIQMKTNPYVCMRVANAIGIVILYHLCAVCMYMYAWMHAFLDIYMYIYMYIYIYIYILMLLIPTWPRIAKLWPVTIQSYIDTHLLLIAEKGWIWWTIFCHFRAKAKQQLGLGVWLLVGKTKVGCIIMKGMWISLYFGNQKYVQTIGLQSVICAPESRWTLGKKRPETSCERSQILAQNIAFCVICKWGKVIFVMVSRI